MKRLSSSRWLIFLPAFFYAFFPLPAHAEPQPGLNAVGYYIDEIPPLQSDDEYPTCGSEIENNINRNFNGEPFQDCGWDYFMVHYTGFIDIPEHDTIQMMVAADDGGTVEIDGQRFGTWNLKGCSWSQPRTLSVTPGSQPLDGWFFEAGGGTCYMLAWKIDDGYWEIVPEWAFTTESTPPTTTTTTTVPETTVPATTTTSTTVPETSTTTSTTEAPTTTTTEAPAPATSQAPPPSVYTPPPATLATPTTEALPPSTTTAPETTLPPVSSTEAPPPLTTTPTVPVTQTSRPPATTLAPASTLPPDAPQSSLVSATPETAITTPKIVIEPSSVSPAQAVAVALNPEVLATVSSDEAEAVFEALAVDELSDTQIDALVEAVQEAPTEVRQAFEDKIDVFGEGFDDYVPLGSTIPVSARRTLIAAGAALAVAASSVRKR